MEIQKKMSIRDCFKKYREIQQELKKFTPNQQQLLVTKLYDEQDTVSNLKNLVKSFGSFDIFGDSLRSCFKKWIWKFIGLAFASLLFSAIPFVGFLFVLAFLFFIVAAVVCGVRFIKMKRFDLPDSFNQLIVPFVSVAHEDMEPNGAMHLKIDLRGVHGDEKLTRTTSNKSSFFSYPKIKDSFYTDPWFNATMELPDKGKLQCEVITFTRKRTITKRGRSGKIKTKYKTKAKSFIRVRLALACDAGNSTPDSHCTIKRGEKRQTVVLKKPICDINDNYYFIFQNLIALIGEAYNRFSQPAAA